MWAKISEERGRAFQSWSSKCKGPVVRLSKAHWSYWKKATLTEVQRAEWGLSLWVDTREVILGQTRQETIEYIRKMSFYLKSNSKLRNSFKRGSGMIYIPLEIKYFWGGLEKRGDRKVRFLPRSPSFPSEAGCNHLTDTNTNLDLVPASIISQASCKWKPHWLSGTQMVSD